ncbi:MAG: chorismate mutase aro7 [Watsoniomyces obsoletus]|nr:MAG: chorismate mutase aro7 [Watsoniomyces obsoletus]
MLLRAQRVCPSALGGGAEFIGYHGGVPNTLRPLEELCRGPNGSHPRTVAQGRAEDVYPFAHHGRLGMLGPEYAVLSQDFNPLFTMYQIIVSALALVVPALALTTNAKYPRDESYSPKYSTDLPPCSDKSTGPCQCPSGTYFGNHTTYGLIGARPKDVSEIIGDYFRTDWVELPLVNSTGPNGQVGTVRTLRVNRPNGFFTLSMMLNKIDYTRKGGLLESYNQVNIPAIVPPELGGGEFHGFWVTLKVEPVPYQKHQTKLSWNIYRCMIGRPFRYGPIQERGINNIIRILGEEGKIKGESGTPFSVGDVEP